MARTLIVVRNLAKEHLQSLQSLCPEWDIFHGGDPAEWLPQVPNAEVICGWHDALTPIVQSEDPLAWRWVQNWGAGVDHMPLSALQARGITLTNASGVHAYPIAETIFGLLLAHTRKIHDYIRQQAVKVWDGRGLRDELHGGVMGLLGTGAIARETARLGKAFGMTVLGYQRTPRHVSGFDHLYEGGALHEMLSRCDYVVNTLPLTDETHHLVDHSALAAMKQGAFYVNIGRGATTDTEALLAALQTGHLSGAGLDVFETEPLPKESPLWSMENVIITPHSSGATRHYDDRMMDILTDNLRSYLRGEPVTRNVVHFERAY